MRPLAARLLLATVVAASAQAQIARWHAQDQAAAEELVRHGPPWAPDEVQALVNRLAIDPARFDSDAAFRDTVLQALDGALPRDVPAGLREMLLFGINQAGPLSYDQFERLQASWGAAERATASLNTPYRSGQWSFQSDVSGPIEASIYSLPSTYYSGDEALAFLTAVHRAAPHRQLIALVDPYMRLELGPKAGALAVSLLDTFGRDYTPWPRDVMSFLEPRAGDRPLVLIRPGAPLQGNREDDNSMGRELLKDLPPSLFDAWHQPAWAVSPVPFHNGQVIVTPREAWISLHTLEPRILEILRLQQVPVAWFETAAGISRYLDAAHQAAAELSSLYGRPVRFVHALPDQGPVSNRAGLMRTLGGGAGFDLDSVLTILDEPDGTRAALVASIGDGQRLLEQITPQACRAFSTAYGLAPTDRPACGVVDGYQRETRPAALGAFLDAVASHLARAGLTVRRLPAFLVPARLLANSEVASGEQDFLIEWNNIVPETGAAGFRAEGFASLLPAGDDLARAAFTRLGYRLDLLPPLVPSVVRNGGYRCASNQLREATTHRH